MAEFGTPQFPLYQNKPKQNQDESVLAKANIIEQMILEDRARKEKEKEEYYELFRNFLIENGSEEIEDWEHKLHDLEAHNKHLLVRREAPERIMELFDHKHSLAIGANEQYGLQPNAAELGGDLQGLRVALAGGFGKVGKGSMAFTIGLDGHKAAHIQNIPSDQYPHFHGRDRQLAKIVQGTFSYEDVRFVLMRIAKDFFPEKYMTDKELDSEHMYVQRMFVPKRKEPIH